MKLMNKAIVRLFASSVSYKLFAVLLGFVNSIIINRYLGVELRGEYTTILNYANLLQLVLSLGLGNAYPAFRKANPKAAYRFFLFVSLAQSFLYLVISLLIFGVTGSYSALLIMVLAVAQVFDNQGTFIALVEDVLTRNRLQVLVAIAYTLLLLIMFFFIPQNLDVAVWLMVVNYAASGGLCLIVCRSTCQSSNSAVEHIGLSQVAKVAIPTMLMNVLMFCNYNLNIIFLDQMTADYYSIGLFGTAVFLANMLWKIPDAFKDVLYSRAARRDNPIEIIACIGVNLLIAIIIIIAFAIFGKELLAIFYGIDFVPAFDLVVLLFVGTLPMIFYKLIHPIYVSNKRPLIVVSILLLSVAINCVGNLFLIPVYSVLGAAISSVASYSICGVVFLIKFVCDYKEEIKEKMDCWRSC